MCVLTLLEVIINKLVINNLIIKLVINNNLVINNQSPNKMPPHLFSHPRMWYRSTAVCHATQPLSYPPHPSNHPLGFHGRAPRCGDGDNHPGQKTCVVSHAPHGDLSWAYDCDFVRHSKCTSGWVVVHRQAISAGTGEVTGTTNAAIEVCVCRGCVWGGLCVGRACVGRKVGGCI